MPIPVSIPVRPQNVFASSEVSNVGTEERIATRTETSPAVVNMPRLPGPQEARADFMREHAVPGGERAPGRLALAGSRISAFFHSLAAGIRNAFARVKVPAEFGVQMPRGLGEVKFPGALLQTMIDKMPKGERRTALNNLGTTLAARLSRGADLLDRVMRSDADQNSLPPPTVQDVSDILLFVQARAWQTGKGYEEGSLSLEDPQGHLLDYFDRCDQVYARSSTHLNEMQRMEANGHLNTHRGIDIPQGVNGLANTHRTMLFGAIPARADETGRPISAQRLFVKTETFGIRLSTVSAKAIRAGQGQYMHHRPAHFGDAPESLGHMCSLFQSWFYTPVASRKERIPGAVKDAYNALLKTPEVAKNPEMKALLTRNAPLSKSGGIRIMYENLRALTERFTPEPKTCDAMAAVMTALAQMPDPSHRDVRIGNEVIFDRAELLPQG